MTKQQIHDAVDRLLTLRQPDAVAALLTTIFNKLMGCSFMTQAELDVIEARLKIALEYLETKGGNDAN